jgi:hypothetical protein
MGIGDVKAIAARHACYNAACGPAEAFVDLEMRYSGHFGS